MIGRSFVVPALFLAALAGPVRAADSVDVALGDVSINKVPFLIAADAGLYARNGLVVHQFITPNAAAAARASGVTVPAENVSPDADKAPIHIGGGSPMITGAVRRPDGPRFVIVATTEDVVRDHVLAQPSIGALADLKGKRIGYSGVGTVTHYDSTMFARQMGWDPQKDVTLVGDAATVDALKSGKVDAILGSAMVVGLALDSHFKDLGDLSAYKIPLAGSGIMVEHDWLAAHRDIVARFVTANVQAVALMKTDRKIFNAALVKWFAITDPAVQARMFAAAQNFPAKPYPAVAGITQAMKVYDSPAMRSHHAEEFYDSSFVAALDKSGVLDHPLN